MLDITSNNRLVMIQSEILHKKSAFNIGIHTHVHYHVQDNIASADGFAKLRVTQSVAVIHIRVCTHEASILMGR